MSLTLHSPKIRNLPTVLLLLSLTTCWFASQRSDRGLPVSTSVSTKRLKHFGLQDRRTPEAEDTAAYAFDLDDLGLKVRPKLKSFIEKLRAQLPASSQERPNEFPVETGGDTVDRWGASDRALLTFAWQDKSIGLIGSLQPSPVHKHIYSGPLNARIQVEGFHPRPPGFPIEEVSKLTRGGKRALIVDTRGMSVPEKYKEKLIKEWKKWEFSPGMELAPSLDSPFTLWQSQNGPVFELRIRSPKLVEAFFDRRFPNSVLKSQSRWHYGTKVHGFEKDRGPAWTVRANTLIATPSGGLEGLNGYLKTKLEGPRLLVPDSILAKELKRLTGTQTGWNLCLFEHNAKLGVRWLMLLKWSSDPLKPASGYLIVDLDSVDLDSSEAQASNARGREK